MRMNHGMYVVHHMCIHMTVLASAGDRWKPKQAGRTSMGADKWLNFSKHASTEACYSNLREQGCRILVASCDPTGGPAVPPYAETRGHGDGREAHDMTVLNVHDAYPSSSTVLRASTPLSEVDWTASSRLAVVFGNEYMGLSNAAVELVWVPTDVFLLNLNDRAHTRGTLEMLCP